MTARPRFLEALVRMAAVLCLLAAPAAAQEPVDDTPPMVDPAVNLNMRGPGDAVIVIGNEAYSALPQPRYAVNDARSVRDYFTKTVKVKPWRAKYMENVTREVMLKEIKRMTWKARRHSTVWVYFAGHGYSTGRKRSLLGVDATLGNIDKRGVTLREIEALLAKNRRPSRIVFIMDAGFGNVSRDGLELIPGHEVEIPETWSLKDKRSLIWAAASDGGPAHEYRAAEHGLFTWSVLGALRGWADGELDETRDGKVTFAEAQHYVRRVPRALGRVTNPTIHTDPVTIDFTLAQGKHLESGPSDEYLDRISQRERRDRFEELSRRLRTEATAFWSDTLQLANEGGEAGREALEAFIKEYENAVVTISWGLRVPEVREARRVLSNYDEEGGSTAAQEAVAAADIDEIVACDDLVVLEAPAMMGQLSVGQRACLDARVASERVQTTKDKISRILLVNAEAGSDTTDWERLMARHLQDIDRSDPDLAMRYAIYLYKGELENQEEAIRWADVSLENKARWEGAEYVKKVTSLYRLRAEASNRLWQEAEKAYRKDPNQDTESETAYYRGWTKDYAREWLDYARASGGKTDYAFNLCSSAAGTMDFCKSGP